MKLEPGNGKYPLSDFGSWIDAAIVTGRRESPDGIAYALALISPREMERLYDDKKSSVVGMPQYCALVGPSPELWLYPRPEKAWDLIVSYYRSPITV